MPAGRQHNPVSCPQGKLVLAAKRLAWPLVLLGLVVLAPATTVNPPEFPDLVNQSDFIVRAVVKSVVSEYARPGSRKIVSKIELEVKEVIAGTPTQPLVLRVMGGKIGEEEMILEGAPQLKVGDENIFFVQGNGRQIYPLVAMMHGLYPIKREAASGREFVARSNQVPLQSTAEVALPMTSGNAAELQRRMRSTGEALTPAQFVQQIRGAVKTSNTRLREK
jgi:hypothetical protein